MYVCMHVRTYVRMTPTHLHTHTHTHTHTHDRHTHTRTHEPAGEHVDGPYLALRNNTYSYGTTHTSHEPAGEHVDGPPQPAPVFFCDVTYTNDDVTYTYDDVTGPRSQPPCSSVRFSFGFKV